MHHYILSTCTLLSIASIGWAQAESAFQDRTHDFGATPRGPMLTHYFRLTNTSKDTLVIGSLRVSCGCVVASAPTAQIKPGESSYITAQMDSRRFTGHKAVTIYVQFVSPRVEEVSLLVKANGRDDLSITPESLSFGTVRKGSTAKASVQVTFSGGSNWQIEDVKSDSGHVKAEAKLIKRNGAQVTYQIDATLDASLEAGKWRTDIWLVSNDPALGKTRIPVGIDVSAPVTATPGALQLGDVKIGDSVEQNVIVRGDKPFKIKTIRNGGSAIEVSGQSADAKNVHILRIAYKPTAEGEVKQSIEIITEDGDEPAIAIPFQAKAIKN